MWLGMHLRWLRASVRPLGLVGLPLVFAAALMLSGCGDERSAEAYCHAFYSKAAPIRQGYVDAGRTADQQPLGALVKVLSSPGDFASIFDGMVDHAPDEIKSDTVVVRDSFRKLQDGLGKSFSNPLGGLGDNLAAALSSSGALQRVDAYLAEHCPVNSPLAKEYIEGSK
jgi:hypothetical protein